MQVRFAEQLEFTLVLVEIESYPNADADRQVFEDVALIYLEHHQVPEVISLVLKPKGHQRVSGQCERTSQLGHTRLSGTWPVVELWEWEAEELFADGDIGLIPWATLARTDQPAEVLVARCVDRIREVPNETKRAALLAVTEILMVWRIQPSDFRISLEEQNPCSNHQSSTKPSNSCVCERSARTYTMYSKPDLVRLHQTDWPA